MQKAARGAMEVTKQKAVQQPRHYKSETRSRDKKQFHQHRSRKSNAVTHDGTLLSLFTCRRLVAR